VSDQIETTSRHRTATAPLIDTHYFLRQENIGDSGNRSDNELLDSRFVFLQIHAPVASEFGYDNFLFDQTFNRFDSFNRISNRFDALGMGGAEQAQYFVSPTWSLAVFSQRVTDCPSIPISLPRAS
jgi:hypothetical protein